MTNIRFCPDHYHEAEHHAMTGDCLICQLHHARGVIAEQNKDLRKVKKERDALVEIAEKQLTLLATAAVEKLTEIVPTMGWDSGPDVAKLHIRSMHRRMESAKLLEGKDDESIN